MLPTTFIRTSSETRTQKMGQLNCLITPMISFIRESMSSEPPPEPSHWEPAVANAYVPSGSFSGSGFTHLILARSPGYTTATADELIPVIEQYFYPI